MELHHFRTMKEEAVADPDKDNDIASMLSLCRKGREIVLICPTGDTSTIFKTIALAVATMEVDAVDMFSDGYATSHKLREEDLERYGHGNLAVEFANGHPGIVESLLHSHVSFAGRMEFTRLDYFVTGTRVVWERQESTRHGYDDDEEEVTGAIPDVMRKAMEAGRARPYDFTSVDAVMDEDGVPPHLRRSIRDAFGMNMLGEVVPGAMSYYGAQTQEELDAFTFAARSLLGGHVEQLADEARTQ